MVHNRAGAKSFLHNRVVHNRAGAESFCITDSYTIELAPNQWRVQSTHGARLFSCTIGSCLIGRAQSTRCKIVQYFVNTIPSGSPIYLNNEDDIILQDIPNTICTRHTRTYRKRERETEEVSCVCHYILRVDARAINL